MSSSSFYQFAGLNGKKLGGVSSWFLQGVLRFCGVFLVVNRGEFVADWW
jgi:hypothetical protein